MPLAARTERALLDAFGLEPSAEGRRALATSLRAAADAVDGDAASPSSEPAPPPRVDDGADAGPPAPASRAARGFDVREYPSAYVALRVMYAGWDYRGFAQQGSDGVRTVEGALFSALRRTRLIAPDAAPEDVAYTRCGRTDAGVSALGQIVSLRLRSKRGTKGRKRREETNEGPCDPLFSSDDASDDAKRRSELRDESRNDGAPRGASSGDRRAARSDSTHPPPGGVFFAEHAEDELDYCALLNRALPEDVRVTGWGYVHESFSARFDCEFRLYKYFFCAFPDSAERSAGPLVDEGDEKSFPEKLSGLDLDAMRDAARRFEGTHDFRNLCKMDARNVHNYVRTVYRCDVVDAADAGAWEDGGGARGTRGALGFSRLKKSETSAGSPPGLCYVRVEGSAFLWHQVRCMAAVLFLVGLRRETPDVVDALLDATKFKNGKPQYEMAPDAPLVLWRCGFARDALRLTASAAARAQMQVHAARHTAASLKRAAVWAELWASLRAEAEAEAGEGDGNASAAREADDASGSLVAGEVVAAACALSAPGRAAGGGAAAKAAYVPLERRATEMTYEERRARIEEKEAER